MAMADVLIIDDDRVTAARLADLLALTGNRVTTATNGKIGLCLLETNRFDLVITAVAMPEMDGIELIMHLKKQEHPPKIIAMTGITDCYDSGYQSRVLKCMAVDRVLHKPFSIDELLASLDDLIDYRQVIYH